jgi:hypothetical protein
MYMLKKSLLYFFLMSAISTAHAETCPNLTDIRINNLQGWKALGTDNGSTLTAAEYNMFARKVETFALAEWSPASPEGSSHCYYEGKKNNRGYLGVYLAKHKLKPDPDQTFGKWKQNGSGIMQCSGYQHECRFVSYRN